MKVLLILAMSVYMVAATREGVILPKVGGQGADNKADQEVDWYDCSNREDGNYIHPSDCTKFMSCVAHKHAYERNCAACHFDPHSCPNEKTHYHHPDDACLWAHEAGCVTDPGHPDPTQAPPGSSEEDSSSSSEESEEECDPDHCWVEGDCHDYSWCERDASDHKGKGKRGVKKHDKCDAERNMYFNPNWNSVHGGVCDFWENLDDETKDKYNKDPACIDPHCEWKPDADNACSSKYWYFHPEQNDGQDQEMHCPRRPDGEQLYWDQTRKSCHVCSSVAACDGHC